MWKFRLAHRLRVEEEIRTGFIYECDARRASLEFRTARARIRSVDVAPGMWYSDDFLEAND
jgi:hypothetical protein